MSWPANLRAKSFAITIGVVLSEFAVPALPIGVLLWLLGVASAARLVEVLLAIGMVLALSIAGPAHLRSRIPIAREDLGETR